MTAAKDIVKRLRASDSADPLIGEAILAIKALRAERDAALADAKRYRWLREQHWETSPYVVVNRPKDNLRLGAYCPSGTYLDDAINAALAAKEKP